MTITSDPIALVRDLNPVPTGSLRKLAAERADELLTRLGAGDVSAPSIRPDHRRRRYLAVAVGAVAIAAVVSVLATRSGTTSQVFPPATTTAPAGPGPAGIPVANAAEADALLSFDVVLPSGVTPRDMNVYKWDGNEQLQAYYNASANGMYSVTEEPTTWSVTALQHRAEDWRTGPAKMVMVDGVHVLAGFDRRSGETDVAWIRGDGASPVITWLVGPWIEGQSFTRRQALAVAADIIGQGG